MTEARTASSIGGYASRMHLAIATSVAVLAGCAGVVPSVLPSTAPAESPELTRTPSVPIQTATPIHTAAPALTAAPIPSPTAILEWDQLTTITGSRSIVGIAASSAGYVVVNGPRTAWFSVDGRSWTSSELPFRPATSMPVEFVKGVDDTTQIEATVNAIVGGPKGFLAVGGYSHPPCAPIMGDGGPPACEVAPISWASADGRTWRSSITTPIPTDGSALPRYSELVRAWPAPDGWDAAVSVVRDTPDSRGNTLLHSVDGLNWTRLEPAPLPPGATSGEDVSAHAGTTADDGRRLTWQVVDRTEAPGTALSTSTDGVSWTRVAGFDGAGAVVTLGLGPEPGESGWLLAGYLGPAEDTPGWWYSEDLRTWRSGALPGPWAEADALGEVARWAGWFVVVGDRINTCCLRKTVTCVSRDGTTWFDTVDVEGPLYLAGGPAGLVGVGRDEDGVATVWLAAGLTP